MKRRKAQSNPSSTLTRDELELLSKAYLKGLDISGTSRAQAMAQAQAERVHREFDKLQRKIRVEFTERDPYKTFEELQNDVLSNKRMYVYTLHSETPLWDERTNWMARAVHDYDHVLANTDFSVEGEIATFQYSAERAPALEPLYLSEIALQAASSAVLGGFEAGPQRFVEAEEDVKRLARQFRRNASESSDAWVVWDTAGALKFMTPEQVMERLGAEGVAFDDAVLAVTAAMKIDEI